MVNGLPLRADIHTLLDLRLLAIEPGTRAIVVSKLLTGTDYEALTARTLANPIAGPTGCTDRPGDATTGTAPGKPTKNGTPMPRQHHDHDEL